MDTVATMEFDQGLSDITGFYQDGREFAVVGLIEDVAVFVEVTNPVNPTELMRIGMTSDSGCRGFAYCYWRDLKYWNRHIYIGSEANFGVKVISVDDLDTPTLVNTISDFTSSHNIHIDENGYLYVIGAQEEINDIRVDIWIYELTDHPANPQLVGTWNGEYLHDIEVYNNKIYGAGIYTGHFYIIDANDKTNPTTLLSYDTGGGNISTHDCAVTYDEQYLITADENRGGHIKIWDISDYENINLVSEYMTHPDHSVHNVYMRPGTDLLIMSYYVDGTRVLNINDPVNPVRVGYYDTSDSTGLYDGNWGAYAYLPSGYILSSDRQNGLFIFESPLTNPSMTWSDCDDCAGVPNGDSWESDCGCVAADNDGNDCDDCTGVPNGDIIVDCSGVCGGSDIIPDDQCDCNGNVEDECGECGGDDSTCIGCMDDAACNYDENNTVDGGSCTYPETYYNCDGTCINDLDEDSVCDELSIYEGPRPNDFRISSIYPNPFNPITNITYIIPEYVNVQIIVYDLSGKQVQTLISKPHTPGYHSVSWNASVYPSGIYIIKMTSVSRSQTQKMVLIK